MIALKNVTKSYGKRTVLSGVTFRIDPKEFVCITGPSGAGKTTLVSLLIGLEKQNNGSIEIDGIDLKKVPPAALQLYRRRIGMVFQDGKLLHDRTIAENVAFPLEICGVPDRLIVQAVQEALKKMSLLDRADSFPDELSGGEQTRAAIARAIVHRPLILIADEPTGNVDPAQAAAILELLKQIHTSGTTVILATHDFALVDMLQTRVIRLEKGKVVRDSVGGYDEVKPVQPKQKSTQTKHDFFGTEGAASDAGTADTPKRKIKITSIGS